MLAEQHSAQNPPREFAGAHLLPRRLCMKIRDQLAVASPR
jgi:hypothetical protein